MNKPKPTATATQSRVTDVVGHLQHLQRRATARPGKTGYTRKAKHVARSFE